MEYKIARPMIRTSVLISPDFYTLCKENHIRFSEAMRIGISLILAERGIKDYDNELNIMRRIEMINRKLTETSIELNELKAKHAE